MQFAELKSLITQYLVDYKDKEKKAIDYNKLHLISVKEFKTHIKRLVDTFCIEENQKFAESLVKAKKFELERQKIGEKINKVKNEIIELIIKYHAVTIKDYIVFDCFYGSCAVFVPSIYKLQLKEICAKSGYIFTCGKNLYIQNTKKANYEGFKDKMNSFLENENFEDKKRMLFKVYSEKQDVSTNDQGDQDSLDKLKIFIPKFYMNDKTILEVLNKLDQDKDIQDKLEVDVYNIYDPENPSKSEKERERDHKQSIFLFKDNKIDFSSKRKGKTQYYICYLQLYKNHNPFYKFEENKPAWIDPVTIPHTLLSAMLNLAEIDNIKCNSNDEKVKVLDTCAGSGTTHFEALKYGDKIEVFCNDISPISNILCKDNQSFFEGCETGDIENLEKLKNTLLNLQESFNSNQKPLEDNSEKYQKIINFLYENYVKKNDNKSSDEKNISFLAGEDDFVLRMLFYNVYKILYKSLMMSNLQSTVDKDDENKIKEFWKELYTKNIANSIQLIKSLIKDKNSVKSSTPDNSSIFRYIDDKKNYSTFCTINYSAFFKDRGNKEMIKVKDILDIDKKDKYDIIVTDLPYGFNTKEKVNKLFRIYTEGLEKLIVALKNPGQLILSLPEDSYNGQKLQYFTQKEFLIKHIISTTRKNDKEIVNPASSLTYERELFLPPYYWESKRSLRRSILHFKIRDII